MNAHERRQLTAEVAEQLLNGHPDVPRHARRLADRLALASAAAFPGELAGEDAAAAAFTAVVGADLVPQPGRRPMSKSAVVAKLLTLKVAAIALAAVSAGGVALAASTGVLPNPLAPSNPGHSTPGPSRGSGSDATPSPSMIGLCTAYLAGAGADHGKALESPAFSALITAAGGKDNVDAFCAALGVTAPGSGRGAGSPSGQPTTQPGATDHPTAEPTAHPDSTDHPTGPPSHPTGTPTSHPSA
jgi:hypothetical protein